MGGPRALRQTLRARLSRGRVALALAIGWSLAGCDEASPWVLDLRVVTAAGGDPVAGTDATTMQVHYRRAGEPLTRHDVVVGPAGFDVALSLGDPQRFTEVAIELLGPTTHRLGALPTFRAIDAPFGARLVVGPAGSCEILVGLQLDVPLDAAGAASVGPFGLIVGGHEDGGASPRAAFVDLLRMAGGRLDDLPTPLGAARAVAVSRRLALVLGEAGLPFLYDLGDATRRVHPLAREVPGGASIASLAGQGAVIVGGRGAVGLSPAIHWVGSVGDIEDAALAVPRAEPALAFDGERLWIAGGEGAESLELAAPGQDGAIAAATLGAASRLGGHLLLAPDGGEGLLLGGFDELLALRTDTVWIHGCPDACVAEPGPVWEAAHRGVRVAASERLLVGGGAGDVVEQVVFEEAGPRFEPVASLRFPRVEAAVLPMAAGVVLVLGGSDEGGRRRDAEVCFPNSL